MSIIFIHLIFLYILKKKGNIKRETNKISCHWIKRDATGRFLYACMFNFLGLVFPAIQKPGVGFDHMSVGFDLIIWESDALQVVQSLSHPCSNHT